MPAAALPPTILPADGEAAAEQWEPIISPLLLQACWQQLEAAWAANGSVDGDALRAYARTGMLAGGDDEASSCAAAGMLGAYLQVLGLPPAVAVQHTARAVQDMLHGAQLPDAGSATVAAAAMLAATHRHMALPASQALAAALLH